MTQRKKVIILTIVSVIFFWAVVLSARMTSFPNGLSNDIYIMSVLTLGGALGVWWANWIEI